MCEIVNYLPKNSMMNWAQNMYISLNMKSFLLPHIKGKKAFLGRRGFATDKRK